MRAVICSKFGEPEELKVLDVPIFYPAKVNPYCYEACGVNFSDTLIIKNAYQYKPKLPFFQVVKLPGKLMH